ncbi:MAG: prepilin-type N-terminal cleavage/methylation domain-containing protein [Acidimicrobiia bacterium]|nr:prepilin-type N-terminal cleavage/methylation domain-containing protein [Acidimicrobiia bacterium]
MNHTRRRGFTLMELLIVVSIILILAAIAIPNVQSARIHTLETAATRHIGVMHTAQTQYFSQYGRFAASLAELGPPSTAESGPSGASLIPPDLAQGEKGGFRFHLQATPTGYSISVAPVTFDVTGRRTFFSDQTLIIRQNPGREPAGPQSKVIG